MGGAHEPRKKEAGKKHPYEDLLAKAESHGSARVIVRLKLDGWKPEGDLPNVQAVAVQRQAIDNLQAKLVNTMALLGLATSSRSHLCHRLPCR